MNGNTVSESNTSRVILLYNVKYQHGGRANLCLVFPPTAITREPLKIGDRNLVHRYVTIRNSVDAQF